MDRDSNKHGPRVDEEMKKEARSFTQGSPVESRAQESREKEGPADGQPTRHDVARYLERRIFPASRDEILTNAANAGAPQGVIERLQRLPEATYEGFPQVWEAVGGQTDADRRT
jgi:hypothetical protein